ncbi:MAG: prepilin-type N-terminal cleavage/methylation domain-containing protein [SAR324 cluster bacterium]|nr:prepilin-type N-terminal cleavage/methylation domain-containing protein [SAR324 cluster bacterium]
MPTDLPFVNFLRKSATNGFTLLETMLSLAVLGILLVLAVPDFYPMLQRQRFENSASEIRALLEETQSLALTNQVSHRVGFDANDHSLVIKRKHSILCNSAKKGCGRRNDSRSNPLAVFRSVWPSPVRHHTP